VVDRRQLNDVMRNAGIPETTHVDAARARELAVRSSIHAILRGSIRRLDTATYEVVLHVIGAEDGKSLVSLVSAAPEAGLTSSVEALARELRARLGESRGALSLDRPTRSAATPSFAAFRLYSEAADALEMRGDIAASTGLLHQAVALDSGFAIAWSYLASNYLNARQIDSARMAYQHALAHADRLSIADQYRLKGDVAYAIDHDLPSAVKWYDLFLAESPTASSGRMNRGFYLSALGDFDKALPDFEQAVALSPFGPQVLQPQLNNEAAVLVSLGRLREARTITQKLSGPFAQLMNVMIPAAESRWAQTESAASVAVRQSPGGFLRTNAVTTYAAALAAQGAVHGADSVLRTEAARTSGATRRFYERTRLLLSLASGKTIEPQSDFLRGDTSAAATTLRALRFAASGDTVSARLQLASARIVSRRDSALLRNAPQTAEAMIAARAKNYRRVVDELGPAARAGEFDAALLDRPDSFLMRWIVANAYEQLGRLDSAATYYELVVQPKGVPPLHYSLRGICYGFAHLRLAQIDERRGDHAAALRELDTLLAAFQKPDSTTAPLLVDARRFRSRLAAPVATSPSFPQSNGAYHVSQTKRFGGNRVGRGSTRHVHGL